GFFLRHQRVLEKTAGITQALRIGQLLAANGADGAADVARRRLLDVGLLQPLKQGTVFKPQASSAVQCKAHPQNDVTPGLLLEQAVAISESARLQIELAELAGQPIQGGQASEYVADLHAVGADILDRCRSHGSGNQAEVLQ